MSYELRSKEPFWCSVAVRPSRTPGGFQRHVNVRKERCGKLSNFGEVDSRIICQTVFAILMKY